MFEITANLFLTNDDLKDLEPAGVKGVIYEHIKVSSQQIEVSGEHIMSGEDGLCLEQDFFGADEAITNYATERENWIATLIVSDTDRQTAWEKRNGVIANIKKRLKVDKVLDPAPPD
jgi:pyrrolysine biosynthesis protein PylC